MYSHEKIPAKPVRITKDQALQMQYELIHNWRPKSDTRILHYGRPILSAASIVPSLYIMHHFRKKLKLMQIGRPVMFFSGVIIPAVITPILHQKFVMDPLLLESQCPVCLQLRSAAIQSTFSILYPIFVQTCFSFFFANTYITYRLPEFSLSSVGEIVNLWKKFMRPAYGILSFHILAQVAVSFFVTEWEAKELFNIQSKLVKKIESSTDS